MTPGKIIILSGPSGSGKTTLYKKLLASPKLKGKLSKTVSFTTREKRAGERHGKDYMFVSRRMFMYKKRAGHFLEHEKVFENFYGTANRAVKNILRSGRHVLLCIDVKGARTVSRKFPKAVKIFVKVPSMKILKDRLRKRGSETQNNYLLRIKTAEEEMKEVSHYGHIIVNDNLGRAFSRLKKVVMEVLDV